jgi:hypothetical protein
MAQEPVMSLYLFPDVVLKAICNELAATAEHLDGTINLKPGR